MQMVSDVQVVADVFDQCDGDINEALEKLTDLSLASSSSEQCGTTPLLAALQFAGSESDIVLAFDLVPPEMHDSIPPIPRPSSSCRCCCATPKPSHQSKARARQHSNTESAGRGLGATS